MKPITPIKIKKGEKASEIVSDFKKLGFGANKIAKASMIFDDMIKDKDCKVFMGTAGALVPAGMKQIIIDMINKKWIDVLVTTGATLTHDLIEGLGHKHYQGHHMMDDKELHQKGLDRMYDVFMENKVYQSLEDFFEKNFDALQKATNIKEFLEILGKLSPEGTILNTCYKNKVSLFCPAISDSGIGLMVWNNLIKNKKTNIDVFSDLKDIIEISMTSKKSGFIYLGGGTPKNFIQQALQFSKGADYGIQITMDRPEPGGSSGADLRESISWGKLSEKAKFVDVICDVTIALPLIHSYLIDNN